MSQPQPPFVIYQLLLSTRFFFVECKGNLSPYDYVTFCDKIATYKVEWIKLKKLNCSYIFFSFVSEFFFLISIVIYWFIMIFFPLSKVVQRRKIPNEYYQQIGDCWYSLSFCRSAGDLFVNLTNWWGEAGKSNGNPHILNFVVCISV